MERRISCRHTYPESRRKSLPNLCTETSGKCICGCNSSIAPRSWSHEGIRAWAQFELSLKVAEIKTCARLGNCFEIQATGLVIMQ